VIAANPNPNPPPEFMMKITPTVAAISAAAIQANAMGRA
jgi:hypothetical protein